MGLGSKIKEIFYIVFGIETKEEKAEKAKNAPPPEQAPTSDKEKEAKAEEEHQWADISEPLKYVCQGGKVQCTFCNPPMADIIVTSSTIMLQDKPWATVKDKDGKVNFNFTGVCTHPSQQKPGSPPPPCKTVISLGEWKDFSETMIGDNNALLKKSTIPCMISGQDLTITDCGQRAELDEVEPVIERKPKIKDVYWKEKGSDEKYRDIFPYYPVTVYVETENYKSGEPFSVKIKNSDKRKFKGGKRETIISGSLNDQGILILEDFLAEYDDINT